MRICIITKFIPPASTDGIPRNRWDYAREFTALGHEVHIITSGNSESEQLVEGIYIHQIASREDMRAEDLFGELSVPEIVMHRLYYSFLVYQRIKELNAVSPLHLIESPLWDIEGYITRLRLPAIPFVVRLETTSMLLKEILSGKTPKKETLNEIETHFLRIADGYVFDSWSILKETERLYNIKLDKKPYAVVHHGIDLKGGIVPILPETAPGKTFKVMAVGRLEKRKGSDILVKQILPALMAAAPDIEVHLVGKDSGEWDGFKEETGLGYHDYIRKHFKQHIGQRIFLYGYVPDEQLNDLYGESDLILALSRYESFGLLYLEAMRKGKPLIVFNTGAVPEIFDDGVDAVILPMEQPEKVAAAVIGLKNDPALRRRLADNALHKLVNHFSAERMAKECLLFFEELAFNAPARKVFQVMNCLTDRDGVSNTTIDYEKLLRQQGEAEKILGTSATAPVKHLISPIENTPLEESDVVIYHYWNYCDRGEYFNELTFPQKVFFFHNMTTPSFFTPDDEAFASTSKGFKQLGKLDKFDVYVAHTNYSLEILRQSIRKPLTTCIIPPVIERETVLSRPYNKLLAEKVAASGVFNIIFVSSIAPHKKQTDLVRFFNYYSRHVFSGCRLTIIGGGSAKYVKELEDLVRELDLGDRVTITGKVSNEDLYAWYRSADLYLSMCEHEGFGVPLAEAMIFDLPVVAYNCTAIPETVGDNGCLFDKKDHAAVSLLVEKLRTDKEWKREVLDRQNKHLQNFSAGSVAASFKRLFSLVREKQLERLSFIKSQPDYLIEKYIYYNDKCLANPAEAKYVDNQFLLLKEEHPVCLTDVFCDVECSFLSHDWSGKVNIQVDDLPIRTVDLFSSGRKIKLTSLQLELAPETHTLRIWPAGEKSTFSNGSEVLLGWIKLLKPFDQDVQKAIREEERKGITPGTAEDIFIMDAQPEDTGEHQDPGGKMVRLSDDANALDDLFTYEGDWSIRDVCFRFNNGRSTSATIGFEAEFVKLDLKFITHAWCGIVEVSVDGYREIIDLYRPEHSISIISLKRTFAQARHTVTIKPLNRKNKASKGNEVFFGGIFYKQHFPLNITDEELQANYKVSVIINTLDRAEHLDKLLKALEQQTYPWFEVVAVNGPSKDRTAEILEGYKDRLKIAHCPEANLSQSRNIGIEYSSGDYVAFIDDDALPCDEYWVENFVYFIIWKGATNIGAVGGPVKHRNTEHYEFKNGATSDYGFQIFREEELKDHVLDGKRWVQGVPGGNNITLKKALYEIGGFDERFIYYLDETDMCIRLARKGYAIFNHPLNYIKHFKAPSKVRKGSTYDTQWNIVARSDMFYALKNGYDALPIRLLKATLAFRRKHFYLEIGKARKEGKITAEEYKKYRKLMWQGFYEGRRWGLLARQPQRILQDCSEPFRYFNLPVSLETI